MLTADPRKQSKEWTPLNSETLSLASNDSSIPMSLLSYGAILKLPDNYRELNTCDLIVFFMLFMNVYISRKLLYPFSKQFSQYYHISIESFSYILASYDIGGFVSIFINCFPPLHDIQIYWLLSLIMISVVILYSMLSFSNTFITLFIIRMLIGFIFTIAQSQIRGILSAFLKSNKIWSNTVNINRNNINMGNKLCFGMLIIESSWFCSTINWVLVGILLNGLNVDYIWYLMCLYGLIGGMSCYFLPSSTVSQILFVKRYQSKINNNINNVQVPDHENNTNLSKQYHLYFFFISYMFWVLAYNCYLSTFGAWISDEFALNAEELGINTIIISCAECIAMISTAISQKCFDVTHIRSLLVAVIGSIATITLFMVLLKFNIYNENIIWMIIFIFTFFSEMTSLNLLIVNLYITPKGLENKSSIIVGVCSRFGCILGVILAPHIVKLYGFTYLIQMIGGIQMAAFILMCISFWQFKRHILRLNFEIVDSH